MKQKNPSRLTGSLVALTIATILSTGSVAAAQPQSSSKHFDISDQLLATALNEFALQSGRQILFSTEVVDAKQTNGVKGELEPEAALQQLLRGTGLSYRVTTDNTILVEIPVSRKSASVGTMRLAQADTPSPSQGEGQTSVEGREAPASGQENSQKTSIAQEVVVTGSRIRGAKPSSPVIVQSRDEIERRGFTDLGAFARSIPQNFSGGQNPGVISSFQSRSENFNSSSTMNLRGLGPDATLTLLNGHRLAYDATTQGIDISAIPLAAIERVDVVADGASALYGSDAVGGVANIVLRRDYSGILTSARFSEATDGGNITHGASVVTGFRGQDSGLMIAGDYSQSTSIVAGDRSYTQDLQPGMTLFPSQRQLSAIANFHQALNSTFELEIDGHVNQHKASTTIPFTASAAVYESGFISGTEVLGYSISPTLKISLPAAWRAELRTTTAKSDSDAEVQIFGGGSLFATNQVGYDNTLSTGEFNAEGPVADVGGGAVRLALGGGFRSYSLDAFIRQVTSTATRPILGYQDTQSVTYAFGEISLPLVGERNAMPAIRRFSVSGAVRYERYKDMEGLATPKLGLIYEPVKWLTVKGSWGRSFKAPTLSQINQVPTGTLLPPTFFLPASPTSQSILTLDGGNPNLGPERARTWTVTGEFFPLPGVEFGVSYYDIDYRDRVVAPIFNARQAFTGSLYQDLIIFNPTESQVESAVKNLPLGVLNQTNGPFDPANVGAIVFGRVQNVASQKIHGIDFSGSYRFQAGGNHFSLNGSATFLESDQKLSANQPTIQMAGTIFRPPHWRWQGSASWGRGPFTVTAVASHIGGVEDRRTAIVSKVEGLTAIDLSLHIEPEGGPLSGFELQLSASNLLNEKPSIIQAGTAQPPYDATNYSSIGRVLGVAVSRRW